MSSCAINSRNKVTNRLLEDKMIVIDKFDKDKRYKLTDNSSVGINKINAKSASLINYVKSQIRDVGKFKPFSLTDEKGNTYININLGFFQYYQEKLKEIEDFGTIEKESIQLQPKSIYDEKLSGLQISSGLKPLWNELMEQYEYDNIKAQEELNKLPYVKFVSAYGNVGVYYSTLEDTPNFPYMGNTLQGAMKQLIDDKINNNIQDEVIDDETIPECL